MAGRPLTLPSPGVAAAALALGLLLAAGAGASADAPAQTGQPGSAGFDASLFRAFVTMRSGTGEPVYWPCSGEVYSFPEGRLLFLMQGLDAGRRATTADGEATAQGLHRSIMVYFDAATGEPLRSYGGKTADPIGFATPFIHYTYALDGDRLSIVTRMGDETRMQTVGPITGTRVRRLGGTTLFSLPLFVNRETPRGPYQVHESNDFSILPGTTPEYHLAWVRYGSLPAFAGTGLSVMHQVCRRVDRFEDVPAPLRAFIEANAPRWKAPPASLNEFPKASR